MAFCKHRVMDKCKKDGKPCFFSEECFEPEETEVCDYCQKFDDPCGVPMIATEEDDCDRGIYLYNGYLCANGGSFCDAKVNFCPMCGRRLDGDADG